MNEEALKYSFDLFVKDGYNGTIDDYKELIKTNDKARSVSYNLFTSDGYNGSDTDFNNLMGIDNTIMLSDEELGKTNDSANVDPSVESDTTGSGLDDGFSESQEKDTEIEKLFGKNEVTDFFGDIARAWQSGTAQGRSLDSAIEIFKSGKDMTEDQYAEFVEQARAMEEAGQTDEMIEFGKQYAEDKEKYGSVGGFFTSWWKNPTVMTQYTAQSLANMASSAMNSDEAALMAAGGVATGAGIGSAIPVVGTILGGLSVGMGALSATMEVGFTTAQLLQEAAIDAGKDWNTMSNKERIDWTKEVVNNEELYNDLTNKALRRGIAIGSIDAVTGALTGGIGGAAKKGVTATTKSALAGAAETAAIAATETAGGLASEIAGQLAAGQELDAQEILTEGFADKTFTLVNVARGGLKGPKYTLAGEKMNGKRFREAVQIMDDATLASTRIEISNDPLMEKIVQNRRQDIQIDQDIDATISGVDDRAEIIKLEKKLKKLKGNDSVTANNTEKEIKAKITEIQDKYKDSEVDVTIKQRQEAVAKAVDTEFEARFNKNYTALKEAEKDTGIEPVLFNDDAAYEKGMAKAFDFENFDALVEYEYLEAKKEDPKVTREDVKKQLSGSDGVFVGKGKVFINKAQAKKSINIATGNLGAISVTSHEVLHPIFNALIGGRTKQGQYVKQFRRQMTRDQKAYVDRRLKGAYKGQPGAEAIELMNIFSDGIIKGEINYDKNSFEKLGEVIVNLLRSAIGLNTNEISFEDGRGVFNFLKEYNTSVKEGKLSDKAIAAIKKAEGKKGATKVADAKLLEKTQFSKQEILDLTDALDAAEDAYAADPNNPTLERNVELAEKALDEAEERAISGAPKPKVVTPKPKKEVKKEDKPKVKKETTSKQKELNEKVDKLAGKKDEDGNYVMSKKEWDRTGIGKASQSIIYGDILNPLITRGITGEGVQGKSLQDFIQAVKDELLPVLMNFNPEKNNSLIGWINSQLRFKKGNVLKRFKKEADLGGKSLDVEAGETGFAGNISGDAGVIRSFADEKQIAPENLIKASKVISSKVRNKLASDLKTWAETNGINFDFFNFGDVDPNITIQVDGKDVKILNEVLEELFPGVNPEKFLDSRTMFTSGEASIVLGKLAENDQELVELFINLLPRGAVMPKGKNKAIVKDANYGKSTRLDGSILKNFYNKGTERFTKKAGLTPFTLKDNIRYSDVHQAFGMDSSGNKLNYQRAKSGIVLASAYKMLGKLILNEVIRTDLGLTAEQQMNVGAGKGDLQFSISATSAEIAAINRLPNSLVEILQDFKNKVFSSFTGTRLSNKLGREDVNKEFRRLQEKYAKNKDFLLILEKIDEIKNGLQSMGWRAQEENLVKTFIKVSKLIKGITITQRKVNGNANELDYKFKFLGKEFVVEVKKNTKAILGSIGLHATKKNGKYDFKLDDKYKSVFSEKQIKEINEALKGQRLNYLTTLDEIVKNPDNEYGLTEKDFKIEVLDNNRVRTRISRKLKVLLGVNSTKEDKNTFPELKPGALSWVLYSKKPKNKVLVDLTSVDKYYARKGANVINFSDVGAFATGDPVKNEFSGVLPNLSDVKLKDGNSPKVEVTQRWKVIGKGDEFTLYQIGQLKLDLVENQRALENISDYNFQVSENLEDALELVRTDMQLSKSIESINVYNNANKINAKPKGISVWDFDDTLAKTKSNVLYTMPGEIRIFHGGDIKSVKDIDGFVYFSEDKKQAAAYAKGNQGEVSSFKIDEASIATEDQVFDVINNLDIKPRAGYAVDESNLYELIDPRFEQSFSKKDLKKLAVALKRKGIKAARFTDTNISQGKNEGRETENIVVFDKKVVQEQNKLDAEQFAKEGDRLMAEGAKFDFSEFSKVVNGSKGPFFEKAMARNKKFGNKNVFILTARPANSANAIHEFLKGIGLNIPLENITGLANSSPQAKADWIVGKAAEGYNDFYFADDATQNVKAVDKALKKLPVKSKAELAVIKKSDIQFSMNTKYPVKWKGLRDIKGLENNTEMVTNGFLTIGDMSVYLSIEDGAVYGSEILDFDFPEGTINIGFDLADTNKKDVFKIFGAVINAMTDKIKTYGDQVNAITFNGYGDSRQKLYNLMAKRYAAELGWKLDMISVRHMGHKELSGYYVIYRPDSKPAFNEQPKEVKEVLKAVDIKSPQRSALQFSKSMNSEFNQMIEKKSGIDARGTISKYKASVMGRKKGRFQFFVPPGAEDFEGLMYKLLDKGNLGEQQKEWFKKSLFDPFARGINEFDTYKLQVANAVRQLKKSLKDIPKELGKRDPKTDFKYEDAVRVYLWRLNGHEIKGISESDIKTLVDIVKNSPNLKRFARQLNKTMGGYPAPQESWLAGTITTDAINMVNTIKRKEFLETWQQNADIIFSEDNLNKLEATFGEDYVEALKDSLYRMKSGRNRPVGANKLTNKFMNWVNDSVATIMFFNTRSALLQTLSTVNFINWGDNNPLLAAKAFGNQKQFWSDFSMLFNSDFLKSRRTGLKNDVNADEIANAAATQTNKAKAALAVLLKAGFLPTQIADSFAIAMGGASFYRNRVNTYMQKGEGKPGMGRLAAEEQAFLDFQEIAEATQQSSRPDRVSQQQASPLGRIILAFANTPMQYMRLTKKAFLDLKNGRGSAKENITKILYYAAIQNVIFSSLQAALFATLFDDEEEEETKKKGVRVANTMLDSMLRGLGIYGAVASTVKNIALEIDKQSEKDRPDYAEAAVRALDLSPPISSKIRKGRSAGRAFSYKNTREKMVGFGLDNPAYYAVGQIASATANIPLDRAVRKANHVRLAFAQETKFWQSVSLLLGFSEWDLNMIEKDKKKTKFGEKMKWKKRKLKKRKLK